VLGCSAIARLQVDHTEEWARTHHTTVAELDHLCPAHHHMKTHDGYRLEPGRGKRLFLSPQEQEQEQQRRARRATSDAGRLGDDDRSGARAPRGGRPSGPTQPPLFGGTAAWRVSVPTVRVRVADTGPPLAA
jgi:hypothetical protein